MLFRSDLSALSAQIDERIRTFLDSQTTKAEPGQTRLKETEQ